MDTLFLFKQNEFIAFSGQHFWPILIIFLIGLFSILFAKYKLDQTSRWCFLIYLSIIPALGYYLTIPMIIIESGLSIEKDLPLHLCRIMAIVAPYLIWKKNRFWLGVFYFWILAGTLNANITPDIDYGFPHWSYFAYWIMHSFLIIIPIYYVLLLDIKINLKDLNNAFWTANGFIVLSVITNYFLDSNYMYTLKKPPAASILDYMGDWPIYLISGQAVALVLFLLLYLPFLIIHLKKKT